MKVLVAHNFYQQPGGEDTVFTAETDLLRRHGHEVVEYTESNDRTRSMNPLTLAINTLWSRNTERKILGVIERFKPDIAHFHNTFVLISPSAYHACRKANVPVVQSLHNPRLLCPAANLYRNGKVCQDCIGRTPPWPGVLHGCYRKSVSQTAVVAAMLTLHRLLGTWGRTVDTYIVFTEFYKNKFIQGGIPPEKIALKPHFVDPDPGCRTQERGDYALFIGRLDNEKGINTLLRAWRYNRDIPLKIRGEGRHSAEVADYISLNHLDSIQIIERLERQALLDLIKNARFLVWPSEGYYETFGMVAIESFACGVPVIASRTGAMSENIKNRHTGLHFIPGCAEDLSAKVCWAWNNPETMAQMGRAARREYETNYTSERNYQMLVDIYERTIKKNSSRSQTH